MIAEPIKVKVYRAWWDENTDTGGMYGWFFSRVYAIEGNKFLVYDDGEDEIPPHFEWVDFEESYTYRGFEMEGYKNKDGEFYRPRVYLVEGE